jgi:hypothetical protein
MGLHCINPSNVSYSTARKYSKVFNGYTAQRLAMQRNVMQCNAMHPMFQLHCKRQQTHIPRPKPESSYAPRPKYHVAGGMHQPHVTITAT